VYTSLSAVNPVLNPMLRLFEGDGSMMVFWLSFWPMFSNW